MVGQFIFSGPFKFPSTRWGYGARSGVFILNTIEKVFGKLMGSSESHWSPTVPFCDGK